MLTVTRVEVDELATAVLRKLDEQWPGAQAALRDDPSTAISTWPQVQVRYVPSVDTDSRCSVAGAYVWDTTPPVLAVADAASAGRRAFTVLHELGHHIQQNDVELAQALLDAGVRGRLLEEAVCDTFAATVLLPRALVDEHLGDAGLTVDTINGLKAATIASRAAVCVRAAQRLPSPGQVVLLDYDGKVQFTAARGIPPVTRGSDQSGVAVIDDVLASARTRKGRTRLHYRDGIRGQELFVQAGDLSGYVVAVLMTDRPRWETEFVLPSRNDTPTGRLWVCEQPGCDFEGQVFEAPCPRCQQPKCPECGKCNCGRAVPERLCGSCFQLQPVMAFDGNSKFCQNCS
jgi:Zn-dependent peptidase ImmA (M78 family)